MSRGGENQFHQILVYRINKVPKQVDRNARTALNEDGTCSKISAEGKIERQTAFSRQEIQVHANKETTEEKLMNKLNLMNCK